MADVDNIYQEAMDNGHSEAWDQRWEKAAEYYRQAVMAKPSDPQAINNMGLALFELEKYDEAEICYQQAAKLSPDEPLPIEKLATIYEKAGKTKAAVDQSMAASDLWLKHRDADKAIENWARVTRLQPGNLRAHSRLALVYERLGRKPQAVREFIAMAALLQDVGQIEEALKAVGRAVAVDPESAEAQQAQELVKTNKTLPTPRPQAAPSGLPEQVELSSRDLPPEAMRLGEDTPEPISEARQAALTQLAGLLFDVSADDVDETVPRGMFGVIRGKSGAEDLDFSQISMHIGLAIDYQTRAADEKAAEELKKALDAGLNFPAAFFSLGLLYHRLERMESAVRNLQRSISHPDFALAARLLIGDHLSSHSFMRVWHLQKLAYILNESFENIEAIVYTFKWVFMLGHLDIVLMMSIH